MTKLEVLLELLGKVSEAHPFEKYKFEIGQKLIMKFDNEPTEMEIIDIEPRGEALQITLARVKNGETLTGPSDTIAVMDSELPDMLDSGTKTQAGFDLTKFKPGDFEKLLELLGLDKKGKLDHTIWLWGNDKILLLTANNPITGVSGRSYNQSQEKDYAGYIGLEGDKDLVDKAFEFIKNNADYKNVNPTHREYI